MLHRLKFFALLSVVAVQVSAINEYVTIANAPKPSVCGNSGVLPGGGTAVAGQTFDVETTESSGYHFGRYHGTGGNFCTWLIPASLNLATQVTGIASSCSTTTQAALCDRTDFGVDFDAAPHTGDGAIIIGLDLTGCPGFYNYFVDSTFASGAFQDPVPFDVSTTTNGGYRYSTLDRVASMVRADVPAYGQTIWYLYPVLA